MKRAKRLELARDLGHVTCYSWIPMEELFFSKKRDPQTPSSRSWVSSESVLASSTRSWNVVLRGLSVEGIIVVRPSKLHPKYNPIFVGYTYFMHHSQLQIAVTPSQKVLAGWSGNLSWSARWRMEGCKNSWPLGCRDLFRDFQSLPNLAAFEPLILAKKSECHNCIDSPNKGFFHVWNLSRTKTSQAMLGVVGVPSAT